MCVCQVPSLTQVDVIIAPSDINSESIIMPLQVPDTLLLSPRDLAIERNGYRQQRGYYH